MKRKLEEFFWMEEDELNYRELFEAGGGVLIIIGCMFLPFYLSAGGGIL